jgi:hypothetical protein
LSWRGSSVVTHAGRGVVAKALFIRAVRLDRSQVHSAIAVRTP